jgi:glyoxylase-like metal-dependent hydrolase (beta-lactamase superfamily II)
MSEQVDQLELVANAGWDSRILVARCGSLVDVFIIVSQRYVVLVDTLLNARTAEQLYALAEPHLSNRQLQVINTHSHWDHAWGNHVFAGPNAAHPAPIIGTQRCAELLRGPESQQSLATMRSNEPARFADAELVAPTLLFEDRMQIDAGDLTLELFLTPGHAADHLAIWIPQIKTLLAGDAAEYPFPLVDTAATLPQLRDSLVRMAQLEPAVVLYCHAQGIHDPKLLQANMAYFDQLEARCRKALADGLVWPLAEDADLEQLLDFPFSAALPADANAAELEDFYRPAHQNALRCMLEFVASQQVR